MKCDELTPIELECNMGKDINGVVHREPWKAYDIDEVDAAIAELKSENKMLKEHIANGDVSRITWIDEATELKAENERLKRALWLARALRARDIQRWWIAATCAPITERACSVWNNVERKCLKKAEEYK